MKKLLTIAAFLISTASFSQEKKDSLSIPADSIAIISTVNMVQFMGYLKNNVSYEGYQKLTPDMVISELYKYAVVEWNRKKKVKK